MGKKLLFVIVFLLLPLSGCGIVSIGYNYADAYLRYSINSYATFNGDQQAFINNEVDSFMRWHRKEMLPEYVSFLQDMHKTAQTGAALKQEEVARFRKEVRALYVKTLQPTIKPAANLLSEIVPGQIDELVESFQHENNKRKDKELGGSPEEQLRKRAERTIDFLENLVGGLSDKQLDSIREMSHQLPYATAIYIQLREDNQARLIELMINKKGQEEIGDFLYTWLTAPESNRSAEEQATMLAFEQASDDMIIRIYAMLTERQRKTLRGNIRKYLDTFNELSKK